MGWVRVYFTSLLILEPASIQSMLFSRQMADIRDHAKHTSTFEVSVHVCISLLNCHNKCHQLGGLKQQKFILSKFWRLELQTKGAIKAILPLKAPRKNFPLPLPSFWWFLAILIGPWPVAAPF